MSNFTIEIKAPELVAVLQQFIGVLIPKEISPAPTTLPQPSPQMAAPQFGTTIPASAPTQPTVAPAIIPPTAPQYQPIAQQVAPPAAVYNAPTATQGNSAPVAVAPAFAFDDLARAASQLMDAGKQQDLLNLLAQFSVPTLTQLSKERYGEFATALRQLGAKI